MQTIWLLSHIKTSNFWLLEKKKKSSISKNFQISQNFKFSSRILRKNQANIKTLQSFNPFKYEKSSEEKFFNHTKSNERWAHMKTVFANNRRRAAGAVLTQANGNRPVVQKSTNRRSSCYSIFFFFFYLTPNVIVCFCYTLVSKKISEINYVGSA